MNLSLLRIAIVSVVLFFVSPIIFHANQPMYYKGPDGTTIFGPYTEEQIFDWWSQGFFTDHTSVSSTKHTWRSINDYFGPETAAFGGQSTTVVGGNEFSNEQDSGKDSKSIRRQGVISIFRKATKKTEVFLKKLKLGGKNVHRCEDGVCRKSNDILSTFPGQSVDGFNEHLSQSLHQSLHVAQESDDFSDPGEADSSSVESMQEERNQVVIDDSELPGTQERSDEVSPSYQLSRTEKFEIRKALNNLVGFLLLPILKLYKFGRQLKFPGSSDLSLEWEEQPTHKPRPHSKKWKPELSACSQSWLYMVVLKEMMKQAGLHVIVYGILSLVKEFLALVVIIMLMGLLQHGHFEMLKVTAGDVFLDPGNGLPIDAAGPFFEHSSSELAQGWSLLSSWLRSSSCNTHGFHPNCAGGLTGHMNTFTELISRVHGTITEAMKVVSQRPDIYVVFAVGLLCFALQCVILPSLRSTIVYNVSKPPPRHTSIISSRDHNYQESAVPAYPPSYADTLVIAASDGSGVEVDFVFYSTAAWMGGTYLLSAVILISAVSGLDPPHQSALLLPFLAAFLFSLLELVCSQSRLNFQSSNPKPFASLILSQHKLSTEAARDNIVTPTPLQIDIGGLVASIQTVLTDIDNLIEASRWSFIKRLKHQLDVYGEQWRALVDSRPSQQAHAQTDGQLEKQMESLTGPAVRPLTWLTSYRLGLQVAMLSLLSLVAVARSTLLRPLTEIGFDWAAFGQTMHLDLPFSSDVIQHWVSIAQFIRLQFDMLLNIIGFKKLGLLLKPVWVSMQNSLIPLWKTSKSILSCDWPGPILVVSLLVAPLVLWARVFECTQRAAACAASLRCQLHHREEQKSILADLVAHSATSQQQEANSKHPNFPSANHVVATFLRQSVAAGTLNPWNTDVSVDDDADESKRGEDGPSKAAGLEVRGLQVASRDKENVLIQTISMNLPPGQIVAVVGTSRELSSALLSTLGADLAAPSVRERYSREPGDSARFSIFDTMERMDDDARAADDLRRAVKIHGRMAAEWSRASLHSRITFLRDEEVQWALPAGIVAGLCGEMSLAEAISRPLPAAYSQAVEASGARPVLAGLPYGPSTMLRPYTQPTVKSAPWTRSSESRTAGSESLIPSSLSPCQWRKLAVCRALCALHRDIVLLDRPTDFMTESEEAALFKLLRSQLRRDQIMVVTCSRLSAAALADKIIVVDSTGVIQEGTFTELSRLRGYFADELQRATGIGSAVTVPSSSDPVRYEFTSADYSDCEASVAIDDSVAAHTNFGGDFDTDSFDGPHSPHNSLSSYHHQFNSTNNGEHLQFYQQ